MIHDIEETLGQLKKQSKASLFLVLLGAAFLIGSVYYSATCIRPLESEINRLTQEIELKKKELAKLTNDEELSKKRIENLQKTFSTLKASTEKLYAVRVTPENMVYEVKATAQATGKNYTEGSLPEYKFSVFINAPTEAIESIKSVTYRFDHPTFKKKNFVETNPTTHFSASYVGWGCLSDVAVTVTLKDGTTHTSNFNMCKSLGKEWE